MTSLEGYRFISVRHGPLTALDGRLLREAGGRLLGAAETRAVVRELVLSANQGDRKHLAALAGADEGPHPGPRTPTRALMSRVVTSVERRRIVFVRGWAAVDGGGEAQDHDSTGGPEARPEDGLVTRAQPDREELALEGRRYLLIPARHWSRYRPSGHFEIVRSPEAKGVCERQATRVVSDDDRKKAWQEAAEWLGDPRRRVTETEGLLLIRHVMMTAASAAEAAAPVATPSQAKKEKATSELTWIEVLIVGDDGRPFHGKFSIKLSDGRTVNTTPDDDGTARFDQIPPGDCTLTLSKVDAADFDPDSAAA